MASLRLQDQLARTRANPPVRLLLGELPNRKFTLRPKAGCLTHLICDASRDARPNAPFRQRRGDQGQADRPGCDSSLKPHHPVRATPRSTSRRVRNAIGPAVRKELRPTPGPTGIFAALEAKGVRYVVIGGIANTLHGSPYPTFDLDICPDDGAENLKRLADALTMLKATEWEPTAMRSSLGSGARRCCRATAPGSS